MSFFHTPGPAMSWGLASSQVIFLMALLLRSWHWFFFFSESLPSLPQLRISFSKCSATFSNLCAVSSLLIVPVNLTTPITDHSTAWVLGCFDIFFMKSPRLNLTSFKVTGHGNYVAKIFFQDYNRNDPESNPAGVLIFISNLSGTAFTVCTPVSLLVSVSTRMAHYALLEASWSFSDTTWPGLIIAMTTVTSLLWH